MRGRRICSEEEKKKLEEENREARWGCLSVMAVLFLLSLLMKWAEAGNSPIPFIIIIVLIVVCNIIIFRINRQQNK